MDSSLFLLLTFAMFLKTSSSIKCYKCEPERLYDNAHIPLCQYFDASAQYVTDCPYSTICYKKTTVLASLGLTTQSVQRGCAIQTRDDEQQRINGKWQYVKNIHEVYSEICDDASSEDGRPTKTTQCYCRGDLCNGARRFGSGLVIVLPIVWLVIK